MSIPFPAISLASTLIRYYEGCIMHPYYDAIGKCWSIGYGFCTLLDDSCVTMHTPSLTLDVCETLLYRKLTKDYMPEVIARCKNVNLTVNQLAALTSFAWNLGPERVSSSGVSACLASGDVSGAQTAMRRYNSAKGVIVAGLVTRRAGEARILGGETWPLSSASAELPVGRKVAHAVTLKTVVTADDLMTAELHTLGVT